MSVSVDQDSFNMGLSMVHSRLTDAVKEYEEFLIIFGTCPDMKLVRELKVLTDKILTHDDENVGAFKSFASTQEAPK